MYKYINILGISNFLISTYILYANLKIKNSKKCILSIMMMTIITFKIVSILGYVDFLSKIILNYIYETIIIMIIIMLNTKKIQRKKEKFRININNIFCVYILIFIIAQIKKLMYLVEVLDLASSIYIFMKISKIYIKEVCYKEIDIRNKLNRSNIIMKMYDEKLNTNINMNSIINDAIKKKQNLLDVILKQSTSCVLLIDNEGYILNEDDVFSNMWKEYNHCKYKINLSTFLNTSIKNTTAFIKGIKIANETNEEVQGEIESKDGRFFSCIYSPFFRQGKRLGTTCVMTDITYKKKSEIKIRENDTKYKKIVDNIPYPILLSNNNDILYNNEKSIDIDFNTEDIKNIILENITYGEIYYTTTKGIELCLNIDRVEFMEGEDSRSLIIIRDITEYKKLLKDIEYSKKKYETLVNAIPEGIYILNFENKVINYANSAFLNIIGESKLEDINLDSINENMVMTSGNTNSSIKFKRTAIKNKYGDDINIECGGMLIDVNKKLKIIGIVRDITDELKIESIERELEEKEKENKIKAEFFINMSHELKTPLNLINSSNQLIEYRHKYELEQNHNSSLANTIEIVKKYLYISMELIDNIMDLAKLESDFHDVNRDYYNIVSISEDVVTEFNRYISSNNINIVFDTDEEEKIVNVDPDDIEKVILTLLSMTTKYSFDGSVIYFDLTNKNNRVVIEIKNEGKYDYIRYIEDKERKVFDTRMSVMKKVIELYEGNINSNVNSKGDIKFNIEIPCEKRIENYKDRAISRKDDFIYSEYMKIYNI